MVGVDSIEFALRETFSLDKKMRFTFESVIGKGIAGVACKISQKSPDRNFVVKVALSDEGEKEALMRESGMLQTLAGSPHIQAIYAVKENPLEGVLRLPFLITEYIENGTLYHFINKALDYQQPLANRLLWRLFSCRKLPRYQCLRISSCAFHCQPWY
ncbi:hypothetical protein F4804DRAFT_269615 [Jackrogersella minutella]|nr:hypothetical protein F4804DRAFT_269615 [Jackrogersella minutella]